MYICIYTHNIYIYSERKKTNKLQFIPTDLFLGCPLIRGFNENNLYHHLYTI